MQGPSLLATTRSPYTPGLPRTQKETKTGTYHTVGGEITQRARRGTAALGFSSQEQVNVEEGFSPSPYSGKINVAICLEQGGSNNREAAMLKDVITTGKIDWLGSFVNLHW